MLWPTLGRVALWLVPPVGRWCPTFGGWCAGSCCASCVRFVFAVLFPLFWTVIQHDCWVRLLIGSLTLCGWGSIPLLSAEAHARVGCLPVSVCILHSFCRSRIARGLLSFPCLGYVWTALRVVWVGVPLLGRVRGGSLSPVAGP